MPRWRHCHPWSLPKNTMPSIETANSVIPAGRTFSSRAHWRALSLAIRQHVPRATGITTLWPEGRTCSIFEAGSIYIARGVHTIIIAGKSFGSGSSRDWAAKGQRYLGVRAVWRSRSCGVIFPPDLEAHQ
jgi:aconitase A